MSVIEQLVTSFQEVVAQVPEILQPFIVLLAAAVPVIEGEGGTVVGILGGIHPVLAGVAAATGNFLSVLAVVTVTSRARTAVVDRRLVAVGAGTGEGRHTAPDAAPETAAVQPESKGRRRFKRWVVRFGVPGASILGPLAVPTQVTSAILVGSGTPRRWVLLWQAVAIVIWTTVATVSAWAALTYVVGVV